jgi:hypothetical protein
MLVVPAAIALITPWAEMVATPVLLELHATARPVRTPPLASNVVAVACEVPTAVIGFGLRATVTDATGTGTTVIAEIPFFPSLVAVIVAPPAETALTMPVALTVATAGLLEDQVTSRPVSNWLIASLVSAESC